MALKLCPYPKETCESFLKRFKKEHMKIYKQNRREYKEDALKNDIKTYYNQNTISVDSAYFKGIQNQEYICNNTYTLPFEYLSICPEAMVTYCPQYMAPATYTVPILINNWSPIVTAVPTPVYSTPIPQVPFIPNSNVIPTQLCPYTGSIVTEPLITTAVPHTIILEPVSGVLENLYKPTETYFEAEQTTFDQANVVTDQAYYKTIEDAPTEAPNIIEHEELKDVTEDPLELYLNLPRDLFPCARNLALDPNPIIDEFCKQSNIEDHAVWIMDLEFGLRGGPRVAITRAIPIYDVKFNSIHCKNTPSAIHPGFESCSEDFKRVLLFYYDCIVSAWYRGYVIVYNDISVENFQAWLLKAMQFFGMCWP